MAAHAIPLVSSQRIFLCIEYYSRVILYTVYVALYVILLYSVRYIFISMPSYSHDELGHQEFHRCTSVLNQHLTWLFLCQLEPYFVPSLEYRVWSVVSHVVVRLLHQVVAVGRGHVIQGLGGLGVLLGEGVAAELDCHSLE